jgi:hypothetical protein
MKSRQAPVSLNELLDLGLRQSFNIGVLTFKFIQLWLLLVLESNARINPPENICIVRQVLDEKQAHSGRVE